MYTEKYFLKNCVYCDYSLQNFYSAPVAKCWNHIFWQPNRCVFVYNFFFLLLYMFRRYYTLHCSMIKCFRVSFSFSPPYIVYFRCWYFVFFFPSVHLFKNLGVALCFRISILVLKPHIHIYEYAHVWTTYLKLYDLDFNTFFGFNAYEMYRIKDIEEDEKKKQHRKYENSYTNKHIKTLHSHDNNLEWCINSQWKQDCSL